MAKNTLFLLSILSFLSTAPNNAAVFAQATEAKNTDSFSSVSLDLTVDQYSESISKETLNKWVIHRTNLGLSPGYKSEFENRSYCPVDKLYCSFILTNRDRSSFRVESEVVYDSEAVGSYIEDLARKVNRDPVDAKFKMEDGKVSTFSEAQNGIKLDVERSVQAIIDSLKKSDTEPQQKIALPYDSKKPDLNYGDVNSLGISSLIGEGTSNFKGSPKNRIYNIKVATERFNGVLIKPGAEFSFVEILGEVDGDHGYLPELVIRNNVTEPEFGGGICQVSTTAFRAAIYSGLKITARKNHAYPVSYYNPQGMDAAIYVPRPDLRFINNTPGNILIQTKIVGTVLTFYFYGTDDGRKTTIDGPTITEKQPDGAMKTSFTQHVFDKSGSEFIKDTFNSSYNSPYKYPHPGGPTLSAKPSNWSEEEWKAYKKTLRDMAKAAANAKQ